MAVDPIQLQALLNISGVRNRPGGFLAVDTEDLRAEVVHVLWQLGIVGLPVRIDSRAPTGAVVAGVDLQEGQG